VPDKPAACTGRKAMMVRADSFGVRELALARSRFGGRQLAGGLESGHLGATVRRRVICLRLAACSLPWTYKRYFVLRQGR